MKVENLPKFSFYILFYDYFVVQVNKLISNQKYNIVHQKVIPKNQNIIFVKQ